MTTSLAIAKTASAPLPKWQGKCVSVIDGDTIYVMVPGDPLRKKIRLYGIDAPERQQDGYSKAKECLSTMVLNRDIEVESHGIDQYGRIIGRIFVDGKDAGLSLCEAGWCWHYKQYAPKDKELASAQKKAQSQQLGIWDNPKPTPPWEFRKKNKLN